MPRSKDDCVRLRHILAAAEEAVGSAEGRDYSALVADRQMQHTLIHCLEIVGEAANQVTLGLRESTPEVPWRDMIDMRNRLIHVYHDINLHFVWRTVTESLPPVIIAIQRILAKLDSATLL